jgi:undecaprenyl-diphosphatase
VHVAAHLPLDVVGGAGLGLLVGSLVLLVVGRPR